MPVLTIHCSACEADFIDSRNELKEGDEAICPTCGVHHEFTREFVQAIEQGSSEPDAEALPMHGEPEFKRRSS
jgi:uncharacterized Zn finger protein (UPF0148 family)